MIDLAEDEDPHEYCFRMFKDALPVVPPTRGARATDARAASGHDAREVIARIPPCYGEATVEKIAANAVMAGCVLNDARPDSADARGRRRTLQCPRRAGHHAFCRAADHGERPGAAGAGFHSRQNVFSNVARANSTLGRALQLILLNLGGARPDWDRHVGAGESGQVFLLHRGK